MNCYVVSSEVIAIVQAFETSPFGAFLLCVAIPLWFLVAVQVVDAWYREKYVLPKRMSRTAARKKCKTRQR
jgi:hypothetical protein